MIRDIYWNSRAGALRRSVGRLNVRTTPVPFHFVPRVITLQDVFVQCQAYGSFARIWLETTRPWCGGAVGMCIETNSSRCFCVLQKFHMSDFISWSLELDHYPNKQCFKCIGINMAGEVIRDINPAYRRTYTGYIFRPAIISTVHKYD